MCVHFSFSFFFTPGCPPLQGSEGGQQNLMGVLETAMKIANQDADAEDEDEDEQREAAKVQKNKKRNPNSGTAKWRNCDFPAKESD